MEKTERDQMIETLTLLTQVEAAMARYYTACSETWKEHSGLWMDLAIEEEKHEKILHDLAGIVKAHPEQFQIGLRTESSAIQSFIASINEKVPDLLHGKVSLREALDFALNIEESILEARFFELVIGRNQRYLEFMKVMNADLENHRRKIKEAIKGV